eukprot:1301894-Alexandrium_andersonii.AAC.1
MLCRSTVGWAKVLGGPCAAWKYVLVQLGFMPAHTDALVWTLDPGDRQPPFKFRENEADYCYDLRWEERPRK